MNAHVFEHEAMATCFAITIADTAGPYARQAAAAAFRELERLESELSRYVETSDIARANRLGWGETTQLGADAFECLLIAADAALATGRAFDPSYGSQPAAGTAADAPRFTLDPTTHGLTSQAERLHLDLGAVGKGYALDRMAETLREWQVTAACLNSGGSTVLALGAPAGMAGWPHGLGDGSSARTLPLVHAAIGASGLAVKGEHITNPRTDAPARTATRAWALAGTAAQADALSTAFFVMGEAEMRAFCAAHPQIGGARITADGNLISYGTLRSAGAGG